VGRAPDDALTAAADHLRRLQSPRGDWEGEMVWCPMITAQYVIVQRIVGRPLSAEHRAGIERYFTTTRTAAGVWGLHPEAPGSVFVTTLVYVALRLLGVGRDEPALKDARLWLQREPGGVPGISTWGKFWLALLDLYGWAGVNACPPELFVLPRWLPFHPWRWYCHTRAIYVAMACLEGRRPLVDLGPLRGELREELYGAPWETIDFAAHVSHVGPSDLHARPGLALRALNRVLRGWTSVHPARLRRHAHARCLARVRDEQQVSAYQALSPVSGLLACLALYAADPAHPDLAPSLEGLEAWRWQDREHGVRYAGARSNAWDTAFVIRALATSTHARARSGDALRRAYAFLRDTQLVTELPRERERDRDPLAGGWCFSDGAHRWPVSDCAAEAVSALLVLQATADTAPPVGARIGRERLREAARFILRRQNPDGGFGTYERRRAPAWLDRLNPSEMFGRCMTEGSYVECTASAVGALARLLAVDSTLATAEVTRGVARGVRFLRRCQRADGSVPAAWGINVTYGLFHFVEGLRATGVARDDAALARAAAWLVAHQKADGGWGEHWTGARDGRYVEHPDSQPVMTAWALLALLDTAGPHAQAVRRGVAWLIERQRADGSWPPGAVNGVFFGSAMLDYRLYAASFPTWALARYVAMRGGQ
jgi:lanosterol synthase